MIRGTGEDAHPAKGALTQHDLLASDGVLEVFYGPLVDVPLLRSDSRQRS